MTDSFPTVPTSWELASEYTAGNTYDTLAMLRRSRAQHEEYHGYLAQLRAQWASTPDYLRHKVFGGEAVPGPDGKLTAQMPPNPNGGRVTVWRINDFPYYFEPGIEHHCLWSTEPLSEADIQQHLRARFPDQPTLYWVNPPSLQSIQAIWHCHVLIKKGSA